MRRDRYRLAQLRADLARDIDVYLGFAAEYHPAALTWKRRLGALLMPSLQACLLYRIARWLHGAGWQRCAMLVTGLNLLLTRVSIAPSSRIEGGLYIPHPGSAIIFHGHAGRDLKLFSGAGVCAGRLSPLHGIPSDTMPVLGDDVVLGSKAFIYGPAIIGSHVRLGFNACVEHDLPEGAIVFAARLRNRVRAR